MSASDAPPALRALVLANGPDRGAVAGARALHRAGWKVDVGSSDPRGGLVGASRWVEHVHVMPRPRGDGADFVAAVTDVHERVGYDLLFGAGDDWMAAAAYYADELPVPVAHPDSDTVRRAMDKLELPRLAEQAGLHSSETRLVGEDLDDVVAEWGFPIVVKNRVHWHPGQVRTFRVETAIAQDRATLDAILAHPMDPGDEPVIQRHVQGRLGALVGVMHEGRLLGRVQQEASRVWPTPSGASARAMTVPLDEDFADRAEHFLNLLGWHGLVELQYLQDDDGARRLVDVNGRFYGSLALAEKARPGLSDAWARSVLGLPVPELGPGRVGVRYQWFAGDVRRALVERRGGVVTDLASSVAWATRAQHSVLDGADPQPVLRLLNGSAHSAGRQSKTSRPGHA